MMKKDQDAPPYLSIRSASRLDGGSVKRMDEYRRLVTLPFYVQMKLDEGYEIAHIGALHLIEMPPAARTAVN